MEDEMLDRGRQVICDSYFCHNRNICRMRREVKPGRAPRIPSVSHRIRFNKGAARSRGVQRHPGSKSNFAVIGITLAPGFVGAMT
jgi:hypothetical protein